MARPFDPRVLAAAALLAATASVGVVRAQTSGSTLRAVGGALAPAGAASQPADPRPAAPSPLATAAAPELEAAKVAWEARPEAERRAIQTSLLWTGDYTGAVDGTFGRMTFEAIRAFQTRNRVTPDGVPDPTLVDLLARAERARRETVGFALVDDAATGVRLGVPAKLVGKAAKAEGGSRWASKDGRIEIRSYALPGQDLGKLFERLKAEGPGHKVGYAVLRTDWFVVADTVGTKRGYNRFERVGDGVRGFIVYSDPAVGPDFDRVVLAIAASFLAEPGKAPTPAETTPGTPQPKPAEPAKTAEPPKAAETVPVATGVAATGLLVAPGRALVVAGAVDACRTITVSGKPAAVAGLDDGRAVALLSWADATAVPPLRLAEAAPKPGEPLALPTRSGTTSLVVSGTATATGVFAPLQRGGFSAPAIDASGRVVGLVAAAPDEKRTVAGLVPAAAYPLVPAATLAAFVGRAGGGVEPSGAAGDVTSAAAVAGLAGRIVPVLCDK